LGSELSPPLDDPPAEAPKIEIPSKNAQGLFKSIAEGHARRLAHLAVRFAWQKWYDILRIYFPPTKNPQQTFVNFYFSVLNSIGWAGLIPAYISRHISQRHVSWLIWFGILLLLGASHFLLIANLWQEQHPDPSGDQLAAEILKAIMARDSGARSSDTEG
jgi:hypothetical protein